MISNHNSSSAKVDGNVTIWDVEAYQTPTAALDKHRSQICAVANLKSQNMLITCGRDQLIAFWNLKDFSCAKVLVRILYDIFY